MRAVVVVGLLGACHGSHPAAGDAAALGDTAVTRDAPPDMLDASTRGPITVTAYGNGIVGQAGNPAAGVNVYFVEPNGTVTNVVTGTDGIATALEPDDTTAWVVYRESSTDYYIDTFEAARIGDSMIAGDPTPLGPDTIEGQAYVAFPKFSDATSYLVHLSCTTGTPTSSSPIGVGFVGCPQEMTANAVVTATDSGGNLAYTSATGIDLTAHTSSSTAISLSAFQAGSTIAVTFTNLPSTMGQSDADLYATYRLGTDPLALQDVELRGGTLTDTMTVSAAIAPVGDQTQVRGNVNIGRSAYAYTYNATTTGQLANVTIDASTMVHPVKSPLYDGATMSLTWTQDAFGADPTIVRPYFSWNLNGSVAWRLNAPYAGSPALALPTPPPAVASILGSPGEGFRQLDLLSYPGKTYRDVIDNQVSGAASWFTGALP